MRAVNLIPADSRRGSRSSTRSGGSVYVLLGALAVAVALVTVYVMAVNRISDEKAKIGTLQAQATQAQGVALRLAPYVEFAKLAQARAATIRQIASNRFDWQAALAGLSRVVPSNTSLQSLVGTVPGATPGTGAGAAGAALTGVTTPAFALSGCTDSQNDVARLISRLRLINGVTQVSLQNSQKTGSGQAGAPVSSASGGTAGCPAGSPSFALDILFAAPVNGGVAGVTSTSGQPVSSTASTGGSR